MFRITKILIPKPTTVKVLFIFKLSIIVTTPAIKKGLEINSLLVP